MNDRFRDTFEDYQRKGFAGRSGYGKKPALLVVDFINGFTDPESPLGGDFSRELAVTNQLLTIFRAARLPVAYTVIEYEPDFRDGGVFIQKVPSLKLLVKGAAACRVDDRIKPLPGELVISKKYASSFFGTGLDHLLRGLDVDTVIIVGCTTSGCVRASAIDSLQYGFHTIVVREGVGDRAQGPHEANLFDIDAKYADVESIHAVLARMRAYKEQGGLGAAASSDFQQWWNRGA